MRKYPAAAAMITSLIAISACGSGSGGDSEGEDGVRMGPGVTDDEIKIAIVSDYSGPIAQAGIAGSLGLEVRLEAANADGGVCGRDLVVEKLDTKYDAQLTNQVYRSAASDVLMIGQFVGSAGLTAVQGNIERDNMPTLSASINTSTLDLTNVYVAMPTFEIELINGLAWAAEENGASASDPLQVGVVTSADAFGEVYLDAVTYAAEQLDGVEIVAQPTYTASDTDFTAQVSQLRESAADVVMLGISPAQTAGIIGQAAQLGYEPDWISSSGAWTVSLAQPLEGLLDNYYISGGYGTHSDDVEGVRDLQEALETYAAGEDLDNFQVGGWINGEVVVTALERACENEDLTREGVMAAMEDLEVEFGDILPPINLGDGDSIVSFNSRISQVGDDGVQVPVTEYAESDAARSWAAERGY